MFITVSLLVLCKHSAAGHVNTSRLISVSMLCGAAAQNKPNDSFNNAFTSCLTQSECVCMRKLAGDGVKKDRQRARVRARTHRSVGLLYEFLFPHLEAALSLLQLLLFSAQVSLQLLQAIQSRLNLTPSHRGNITQTPSYHRCTHSQRLTRTPVQQSHGPKFFITSGFIHLYQCTQQCILQIGRAHV